MGKHIRWNDEELAQIARQFVELYPKQRTTEGKLLKAQEVLPLDRRRLNLLPYRTQLDETVGRVLNGSAPPLPAPKEIAAFTPPEDPRQKLLREIPMADLILEIERRREAQYNNLFAEIRKMQGSNGVHPVKLPVFEMPTREKRLRIATVGLLNEQFRDLGARYRNAQVDLLYIDKDKSPNEAMLPRSADLYLVNQRFTNHGWSNLVRAFCEKHGIAYSMIWGGLHQFQAHIEETVSKLILEGVRA